MQYYGPFLSDGMVVHFGVCMEKLASLQTGLVQSSFSNKVTNTDIFVCGSKIKGLPYVMYINIIVMDQIFGYQKSAEKWAEGKLNMNFFSHYNAL